MSSQRTFTTPFVFGGADGADGAADVEEPPDGAAGGGPYCAATRAGRARSAREVVKIMLLEIRE